jgi:hypothetical protein
MLNPCPPAGWTTITNFYVCGAHTLTLKVLGVDGLTPALEIPVS